MGLLTVSAHLFAGHVLASLLVPWLQGVLRLVFSFVLGTVVIGTSVIALAAVCPVPQLVWQGLWIVLAAGGCIHGSVTLVSRWRLLTHLVARGRPFGGGLGSALPSAVLLGSLFCVLAIAIAPSSKIDELHYHMLLAKRVLHDGQFHFYLFPWEGAILPQTTYQYSHVLVFAMGYPDSANVVGAAYFVVLLGLVLVSQTRLGVPLTPALWVTAAAAVGTIAVVTYPTAGSHAFTACTSAALVLVAMPGGAGRTILPAAGGQRLLVAAVLSVAVAAGKLNMAPLAALCLCTCFVSEWVSVRPTTRAVTLWLLCVTAIWATFYLPLLAIATAHSGSPFGPVLSDLASKVGLPQLYYAGEMDQIRIRTLQYNTLSVVEFVKHVLLGNSPAVWMVLLASLPLAGLTRAGRVYLMLLHGLQFGLIFSVFQNDPRLLGGFYYGLLPFAAAALSRTKLATASLTRYPWALALAGVVVTLPWLAGMLYYSRVFAGVTFGFVSREEFTGRYTAFREDFLRLDSLLPAEAEFLIAGSRLNSVSSCRPVVFDARDCRPERAYYLFLVDDADIDLGPYHMGPLVYENPDAVAIVSRQPRVPSHSARLRVYKLFLPR